MFVFLCKKNRAVSLCLSVLFIIGYVFFFTRYILKYRDSTFDAVYAQATISPCVILDAGHGGEDVGTVSKDGTYEKDLNMQMTTKIGQMLSAQGYTVIYTRESDALLYTEEENVKGLRKISDLKHRTEIANSHQDALFISIHMNSFTSETCEGLQVYFGLQNEMSMHLASSIQNAVVRDLQPNNQRKIKEGKDIYVLENTKIEAVLIECGFLSNPYECEKLKTEEYQKKLSFAIVCGIVEYINEK